MFKKKASFRGTSSTAKEINTSLRTATSSSSPESSTTPAVPTANKPPQSPVAKKVEVVAKPKPVGPTSIVPAGTKRVLVVGKFVVMTADVENCDAVIVQGNLDGNIKAKYVVIMKGESIS